jgi:DNA-binding CsgD family transcriptional regulator/tetratricopeptide (TPR) repeat protein
VGRTVELRLLDELLEAARAGEPVAVLVCGEAGSGKTRLMGEVAAAALAKGIRTLMGSCTMVGRTSLAFAPFVEALRPVVKELGVTEVVGARVPSRLGRVVAVPRADGMLASSSELEPIGASAQLGLFEEVLDVIEQTAVPAGLLVVIEDVHWADTSSRGLFEFLSRSLREVPVALMATVRTDEPDDAGFLAWLAEVQRGPQATRIDLDPFSRDELAELLAGVLGESPSVDLIARVYERSGGNAFMAEELVAAGVATGVVPGNVRSVLLARVATLSAPARGVLQLAAVAGLRVDHALLAAAGGLPDGELDGALRDLSKNHLLLPDPTGRGYAFRHALTRETVYDDLLPGERQRLHRALARALARQPALGPPSAGGLAEALAEHWFLAGEVQEALAASVAAGNAAREVLAVGDAVGHYQRALDLWGRVPDPQTVADMTRPALLDRAAEAASSATEHDLALRLVDAAIGELCETGGQATQIGLLCEQKTWYLDRAGRFADVLDWTPRALALVPSDPPTAGRAGVLASHANALTWRGRYDEGWEFARAALDTARRAGARPQEANAHMALGCCAVFRPDAGVSEFEQVVAIGREIGDADWVMHGSAALTDSLMRLGRLDDAATAGLEAADAGRQLGAVRHAIGGNLFNAAEALLMAGRWDHCAAVLSRLHDQRPGGFPGLSAFALTALLEALRGRDEIAAAAAADARDFGVDDPRGLSIERAAQAVLALNRSDLDGAKHAALEGIEMVAESAVAVEVVSGILLPSLGLRIEADRAELARIRRDAAGESAAVEAVKTVGHRTEDLRTRAVPVVRRREVARRHRILCDAELSRAEGRSDAALWRRAAGAATADGDPYRTAYSRFREAEAILAHRGKRASAVDAVNAGHATVCRLGADPLRRQLENLARRAQIALTAEPAPAEGGTSSPHEPVALGLTARELEVLSLLAAGYSNPQIGEALYISRKTASHHVSRILAKLGVATRVEAAGIAHRVGLVSDTAPE